MLVFHNSNSIFIVYKEEKKNQPKFFPLCEEKNTYFGSFILYLTLASFVMNMSQEIAKKAEYPWKEYKS